MPARFSWRGIALGAMLFVIVIGIVLTMIVMFGRHLAAGLTAWFVMASAVFWLVASVEAEVRQAAHRSRSYSNLINAVAATFAALGGISTVDYAAWQMIHWLGHMEFRAHRCPAPAPTSTPAIPC